MWILEPFIARNSSQVINKDMVIEYRRIVLGKNDTLKIVWIWLVYNSDRNPGQYEFIIELDIIEILHFQFKILWKCKISIMSNSIMNSYSPGFLSLLHIVCFCCVPMLRKPSV